jgi:hypothetical protein
MNDFTGIQTQTAAKPTVTPVVSGTLQRTVINSAPVHAVSPIVTEVLRSPGQPLDANTRAFMEPRFGRDFSDVRVHTDAKAAESAQTVNALAFTVGRDIAFAHGQYAPSTNEGRKLLTHELTHVVQQSASPADEVDRLEVGSPPSHFEREATAFAHGAALGSAGALSPFSQIGIQVQHQPRPGAGHAKPKLRPRHSLTMQLKTEVESSVRFVGSIWLLPSEVRVL